MLSQYEKNFLVFMFYEGTYIPEAGSKQDRITQDLLGKGYLTKGSRGYMLNENGIKIVKGIDKS